MADDHAVPKIIENLQQTLSKEKGIFKGKLYLNIKHIKELYRKINKPRLKIKIEKLQPLILKSNLKDVDYCVYDSNQILDISVDRNVVQDLRIEVYDSGLISDTLVCFVNIKMETVYNNVNKWMVNDIMDLTVDQQIRKD